MGNVIPIKLQNNQAASEEAYPDDALESLNALVDRDMAKVNQIILHRLDSKVDLIPKLAGYLIGAGGKRLRPMLTLASAKLCNYQGEKHCGLAAAVEFIHTATLLHDDVVDASIVRRGEPSANTMFGNQASILVGDFLFSRSFQLMVEYGSNESLKILSDASAVIAEGEVLQLTASKDFSLNEQAYLDIARAKTAELFAAACRIGAVVAGRSPAEEEALRSFGLNLGIAFQIVDDVLDYNASEENLGETVGNDFHEGKVTLPVILAIKRGNDAEKTFWQRALSNKEQNPTDFMFAREIIKHHNGFSDAIDLAKNYASIARDILDTFADGPAKQALLDVVNFTVDRKF